MYFSMTGHVSGPVYFCSHLYQQDGMVIVDNWSWEEHMEVGFTSFSSLVSIWKFL